MASLEDVISTDVDEETQEQLFQSITLDSAKMFADLIASLKTDAASRIRDEKQKTLLMRAVEQGRLEIVSILLAKKVSVDQRDEDTKTVLHIAAYYRNQKIMDALLRYINAEMPKDIQSLINSKAHGGFTPLHVAVSRDNKSVVRVLLKYKADINSLDANGNTPVFLSCKAHFDLMTKLLLSEGANPNLANNSMELPLHHSIENSDSVIVELLVDRYVHGRANVNIMAGDGYRPIQLAFKKNAYHVISLLRQAGATIKGLGNLLHQAVFYSDRELLSALLDSGESIDEQDKDGNTALHCASMRGESKLVDDLLISGADVFIQNKEGKTAADVAGDASIGSLLYFLQKLPSSPTTAAADASSSSSSSDPSNKRQRV
jgi:ankyrin repeat protein